VPRLTWRSMTSSPCGCHPSRGIGSVSEGILGTHAGRRKSPEIIRDPEASNESGFGKLQCRLLASFGNSRLIEAVAGF